MDTMTGTISEVAAATEIQQYLIEVTRQLFSALRTRQPDKIAIIDQIEDEIKTVYAAKTAAGDWLAYRDMVNTSKHIGRVLQQWSPVVLAKLATLR